jgi:hypothetical protein
MREYKIPKSISFIVIFAMIASLRPWFFFAMDYKLIPIVISFLFVLVYVKRQYLISNSRTSIITAMLAFVAIMFSTCGNINAYIANFFGIMPFVLFMLLNKKYRIKLFYVFNKVFSIIITISLFFWILHLLGVSLPNSFIQLKGNDDYHFHNYYFFVSLISIIDSFFPRFFSIFLEPGFIACLLVLLLYLDKFNFKKWYNIVYLIALIMTFSLAGFVLFIVAFLSILLKQSHNRLHYILILIILSGVFFYFNSSTEDNVVTQMFGSRLKYDVQAGKISGYNRTSDDFDYFWKNTFKNSGHVLFGYGTSYESLNFGSAVDLRAFIVRDGLIAAIMYVIFLLYYYIKRKSYSGLWLFIIILLIAYRGYTVMFWDAFTFLYIIGMDLLKEESSKAVKSTQEESFSSEEYD